MKILLIEDDQNKQNEIKDFVEKYLSNDVSIDVKRSFQSGYQAIINNCYDLLLLDMSMPTFDIGLGESGGRSRPFAGKDILMRLKARKIRLPVVVVTQFVRFGDRNKYITLSEIKEELRSKYSENYINTVYYQSTSNDWKKNLQEVLNDLFGGNYENINSR